MRYTVNISFKRAMFDNRGNIVEKVKTLKEAMEFEKLIDHTVDKAVIIDNASNKVIWLKQ